ncbi:4'-phosphopantetheinyl transferase family protein [Methylomarinum vadi]|uniref:4'-phosphopantetheinyl transferase family protein n=1 Tax=Methylomarinum vadi TaxID=438855 RepID=UPI0012691AAF|nr:4'-phosphopantetheinyl transferase superfamily protein [Methylomarinum vadi]
MITLPKQGAVQLWHGTFCRTEQQHDFYYALLDEQERQAVERMRRPEVLSRYLETRARLRLKLSEYLGHDPAKIQIARTEHGKPYLPDHPELSFNLSHSGENLLLAVTSRAQIGVDVETIRPRKGLDGLARKCFADTELNYWRSLPEERQTIAFYRLWTAKEAFVKATGRGIALGLDQVVFAAAAELALVRIPVQYGETEQWQVSAIELGEGLCAAVCLEGAGMPTISLHSWNTLL